MGGIGATFLAITITLACLKDCNRSYNCRCRNIRKQASALLTVRLGQYYSHQFHLYLPTLDHLRSSHTNTSIEQSYPLTIAIILVSTLADCSPVTQPFTDGPLHSLCFQLSSMELRVFQLRQLQLYAPRWCCCKVGAFFHFQISVNGLGSSFH